MNSDEYHTHTLDNEGRDICTYCDKHWGDHEHTCPYNPDPPPENYRRFIQEQHEDWGPQ